MNCDCNRVEFVVERDLAQYKGSDYSNAVRVERGISLEEAKRIAANDSRIGYFVYMKSAMALEFPPGVPFPANGDPLNLVTKIEQHFDYDSYDFYGRHCGYDYNGRANNCEFSHVQHDEQPQYCRFFNQGDVVFFKNEGKWLGTAPGFADVYSKI